MEKQITFSQLRATFKQNLNQNSYLVFETEKQKIKTERTQNVELETKWNTTIELNVTDEMTIVVKMYGENETINSNAGQGKIAIKQIKDNGELEILIIQDNGNELGTLYCKYSIKSLPAPALLTIKSIKCQIYKTSQKIERTKPLIQIQCNENTSRTPIMDKISNAQQLQWKDSIPIPIKDNQKIIFSLQDEEDNRKIFSYTAYTNQFKMINGKKRFYVLNFNLEQLGTLEFQYQTQNFVSEEESKQNEKVEKMQDTQIKITIESIKGTFNNISNGMYFKMMLGRSIANTQKLQKVDKDFSINANVSFYTDKDKNTIMFVAVDDEFLGRGSYMGAGELKLDSISQGKSTVKLQTKEGNILGEIIIKASVSKVPRRQLFLSDINVKISEGANRNDRVFVIGNIGTQTDRTQTEIGQQAKFTKNLSFVFSDEKILTMKVMKEKFNGNHELLSSLDINLEDYSDSGQMNLELVAEKENVENRKSGELVFKHKTINGIDKQKSKINEQPPLDNNQEPSKQQVKQEFQQKQPKNQQTQKQQPKLSKKKHSQNQQSKSMKQANQITQHDEQQTQQTTTMQVKTSMRQGNNKNKINVELRQQQNKKQELRDSQREQPIKQKNMQKQQIQNKISNHTENKITNQTENKITNKTENKITNKTENKTKIKTTQDQYQEKGDRKKSYFQQSTPSKKRSRQQIFNKKVLQQISKNKSQASYSNNKSQECNQPKSIQMSRQTLKLPSIEQRNYGDKIYDKQSSATLQKSIHVYSVPKANRFTNGPKYSGEPSYYVESCFKSNSRKGAGFGYGRKKQFPEWMQRNMKENPAPGAYFDQHASTSGTDFRIKGPSFGISFKYYEKVFIPREKNNLSSFIRKSPDKVYPNR